MHRQGVEARSSMNNQTLDDPDFMALIDGYNRACEALNDDWIDAECGRLVDFGAWVDVTGHWRHPFDTDVRPLNEIIAERGQI